jgi:hypothetical protein
MTVTFLSFFNGYFLFEKKRNSGAAIEKCNIENFGLIQNRGLWIKNFVSALPELHYFKFFQYPENQFPGSSIIKALSKKIEINEDCSYFLADFMTVDGTRIVGNNSISQQETKILAEEIRETFDYFDFIVIKPGQILAWFPGKFPYLKFAMPFQLINRNYTDFLTEKTTPKTIARIVKNSYRLLDKHPVNKVKVDLGENPANFLWFHSQNIKTNKIIPLSERVKCKTIFWPETSECADIANFLGFDIVKEIPENLDDDTLLWIDFCPQSKDLIGLIHTWESVDKNFLPFLIENSNKFLVEFNNGFYKDKSFCLSFLYPENEISFIKKIVMLKKLPGYFLISNG